MDRPSGSPSQSQSNSTGNCIPDDRSHGDEPPTDTLINPEPKKRRGRPFGSKNKKSMPPPPVIPQPDQQALVPVVIEISPGANVMESLVQFARRWQGCLTVLSGSGLVSDVTIRNPCYPHNDVVLPGPCNILSLSGTFLPPSMGAPLLSSSRNSSSWSACSIFLATGYQCQTWGGVVVGKFVAASSVVVLAAVSKNPEFHKLTTCGNNVMPGPMLSLLN